jgi:outer membrane protein OmpA-like peptidoglycan-associated protein
VPEIPQVIRGFGTTFLTQFRKVTTEQYPEDKDKFEDENGCPDPDNDRDAILDVDDKCPNDPEDTDNFEDADGCPDPDNDKDGILDVNDKCPNDPEDTDGFEDADGCPDPDNDKDGILDVKDRCPNEPETVNGTEDEDGCPDAGVSKVRLVGDRIEIMEIVHFDFNKATIQKISYELLNQVAKVVGDHPEITLLRVEGHTDSKGEDAFNLKLSQDRANAVRAYLVKRGIAKSRLNPVGYGETRPVESNADDEGRSKNRRVEFVVEKRSTP